ncbi:MAG: glycosyltransferase family 4 protein [Spirulinaceae cyanobacterium]
MKLLFLSTPVGPLGNGAGGGVELTIKNLVQVLQARGHEIDVLAPEGSHLAGVNIIPIPGVLHTPAQTQDRATPISQPEGSVLYNMVSWALHQGRDYDLRVNFAYDWMPFYWTMFLYPIAHFITMGSLSDALDQELQKRTEQFPGLFGLYTRTQAETFPFSADWVVLGSGLDLNLYEFCAEPQRQLAWLGRLAPEKALEDAVQVAQATGIPLQIFGKLENPDYWQQIQQDYPDAPIAYRGFLGTRDLQQEVGQCQALLMTPRWVEAFGNVAIEALACGVPVIAYRRGGPAEIVREGETGFLVEPDDVAGLIAAVEKIETLDRARCRQQAEADYSLAALGDRFEQWFEEILAQE